MVEQTNAEKSSLYSLIDVEYGYFLTPSIGVHSPSSPSITRWVIDLCLFALCLVTRSSKKASTLACTSLLFRGGGPFLTVGSHGTSSEGVNRGFTTVGPLGTGFRTRGIDTRAGTGAGAVAGGGGGMVRGGSADGGARKVAEAGRGGLLAAANAAG